MNPVYSPGSSGVPYANAKGIGYPAGFPVGHAAAAPAYSPNRYPGANPTFQTGYTPGSPYEVSCSPTSGAVPPYTSSPTPYQTAVHPVRSAYPQQSPRAQRGTHCTQPLCAAPPHVIPRTTAGQPSGVPATAYPAPIPRPGATGSPWAMSAGTLLTARSPTPVAPHPVTVPTYRAPGTPTYSDVPPQWWLPSKGLRMELCSHVTEVSRLVLSPSASNQDSHCSPHLARHWPSGSAGPRAGSLHLTVGGSDSKSCFVWTACKFFS
ncbi:myelin-associated neurite-outgrowth inhibitor-like [Dasypus novemcinctus]|uniref:myelin-associated neurite-outgrowth inhibitor-like n=1 Tax=Dasypus novemcinctus TaxID=9361 RepID=UPI00265E8CE9|nr:myelin-associated neurite-outgrowth inhibitor-like [Dasypus novemcinctus]